MNQNEEFDIFAISIDYTNNSKELQENQLNFAQFIEENQIVTSPNNNGEQMLNEMTTRQFEEYRNLMKTKIQSKNIPKIFGNYFHKYCLLMNKKNPNSKLPQGVIDFIKRKPPGKQSTYGLEDFRKMCSSSLEAQSLFYNYTTNQLYLDILHSNRINNPLEYVNFIEQFAAGGQEPEKFISNVKFAQIEKKIYKRQCVIKAKK